MKKIICLLPAVCLLFALAACGAEKSEPEITEWTRQGYYTDENENMLSVTRMDDVADPGWYVGFFSGEDPIEDSYGGIVPQEGNSLHGSLTSGGDRPALTVTVTEEGEDGLQLAIESGETFHFKVFDMPTASIFVSINTEGWGNIAFAEGEEAPEIDPEYPYQSAQINLGEPAVHTFLAWPNEGSRFVKWTKNGEDFSTEPQISVLLDESADFIAVFEEDPDGQNPDTEICSGVEMVNPWREISEAEAKALFPQSVVIPEGAVDAEWRILDSAADPSGMPGALVQLSFILDGTCFTAREQLTGDPEADISGMYYDWIYQLDDTLKNWGESPCHLYRFFGEEGYADLCTWYDAESGTSYSVAVTADDLDGFDLIAIAEALHG